MTNQPPNCSNVCAGKSSTGERRENKKTKIVAPISDEEKPFELPEGWEWSYLQILAYLLEEDLNIDLVTIPPLC